ncbi:hypothetical protein GIB67_012201 [Kingdonia uniflora]|uniref:J domain-containing protein n=1 Tax=Kingdonia uniflora TaxID=39325 RepID=A0A7J7NEU6_9MAGN|nr:hypothetical protein GIB67_012201 [Kingdonia uniflora]
MQSSGILLYQPSPSTTLKTSTSKKFPIYPPSLPKFRRASFKCNSTSSSIMDFDLYDLLGIDSSSDQSQIKMAYRTLQKRCHPDIAGRTGHDMAIILNEAYSILSDPNSRLAYDKDLSHQKEAMMSAIHTIRSISNWLYWQMPNTGARGKEPRQNLLYLTDKSNDTSTKKLRDAAAARQNFVQN